MFEPFQKFIVRAANQYGVSKEVQAAKICNDFLVLVPEIFKSIDQAPDYIKPGYYKDNILMINVKSPAFAQEVIMRKPQIIEEMNKKAGTTIIRDLRCQLKFNLD